MILSLFSQLTSTRRVGDVEHLVRGQAHDLRRRSNSRARISGVPRVPISPRVRAMTPVLWPNAPNLISVPPQASSTSSACAPKAKASKFHAVSLNEQMSSYRNDLMIVFVDLDGLVERVHERRSRIS